MNAQWQWTRSYSYLSLVICTIINEAINKQTHANATMIRVEEEIAAKLQQYNRTSTSDIDTTTSSTRDCSSTAGARTSANFCHPADSTNPEYIAQSESIHIYRVFTKILRFSFVLALLVGAAFYYVYHITRSNQQYHTNHHSSDSNNGRIGNITFSSDTRSLGKRPSIGVVHLGKSGGIVMLKAINSKTAKPNAIADRNPEYFHLRKPEVANYRDWIALVRDPIARIRSSWIFEHPLNSNYRRGKPYGPPSLRWKLYDCYPTLNDAVTIGLSSPTVATTDDDCAALAKTIFSGQGMEGKGMNVYGMPHFQCNFRYYYHDLLSDEPQVGSGPKRIFVVRTKHMLNDLNAIHNLLGTGNDAGDDTFPFVTLRPDSHFQSGRELPMTDRRISSEGMRNLCHFICEEIQIYKQLLQRAVNVRSTKLGEDPAMLMPELFDNCPEQVRSDRCPAKFNNHSRRLSTPNRQ